MNSWLVSFVWLILLYLLNNTIFTPDLEFLKAGSIESIMRSIAFDLEFIGKWGKFKSREFSNPGNLVLNLNDPIVLFDCLPSNSPLLSLVSLNFFQIKLFV